MKLSVVIIVFGIVVWGFIKILISFGRVGINEGIFIIC